MKRVIIGLSGGVDSSVAAHLLLEQGYEVIAIFMRNWNDESVIIDNECPWVEDSNDALLVAEKLGIPFQVLDLSDIYKKRIVDYMFREYAQGRTPNPDVLCNREIKFDVFLEAAMNLGADYVATGHYCQKTTTIDDQGNETHHLIAGADLGKDQSYFLCQLSQQQLAKALFPIGHLQKSEVRKIAAEQELITANKKDSQGLCFIGKVRLPDFLQQQLKPKKGKVYNIAPAAIEAQKNADAEIEELVAPFKIDASMGEVIGEHNGAHYYTIGQRKGLGIGGFKNALFVIGTDTDKNEIYLGLSDTHPGLYRKGLSVKAEELHWVNPNFEMEAGASLTCDIRIRYRQALQKGRLTFNGEQLFVAFDNPQRGITPGQFVAFYEGDELVGSGVIEA